MQEIITKFKISEKIKEIKTFGDGLINHTYIVKTEVENRSYILQSVNHKVFPNVEKLSENIQRICEHLKRKFLEKGINPDRRTLTVVETIDNKQFYKDEQGNYWRVFKFIEKSITFSKLENNNLAYQAGKGFGEFLWMLSDMQGEPLFEVIPNFHNTAMRIENFFKTVDIDPVGRVALVKDEIAFIKERVDDMKSIINLGKQGLIPLRTIHNDTKISNILLDENNEALCVIDLDTVMPGYSVYDFGDAIRTSANTGKEDDKNLDNVSLNIQLFEYFAKGYIEQTKEILTDAEKDNLAFGAKLLTYEQAVRFLDDFIAGDKYYKTEYTEHNLVRTKAQLKLLKSMENQYVQMLDIVKHYF